MSSRRISRASRSWSSARATTTSSAPIATLAHCWSESRSLAGIYNIGAGNRGIARALEEAGRDRSVVYIGHELTPYTRRFLVSGTMDAVIDQNPRVEARDALERLVQAVHGTPGHPAPPVRIQAIFKENIPYV